MILIINTVNLKVGGAYQRAISFLRELNELGTDEFHVFLNNDVANQLDLESFKKNFKFYLFEASPASLKSRGKIVREFNNLESRISPDLVFSFVGPCYWRPRSLHLVGYGIPHIVYNDFNYVRKYSWRVKLEMLYKKRWTRKEADFYIVQTEDIRERLSKKISVDRSKISVVSNGIGRQYRGVEPRKPEDTRTKKLLMISTYRPSKNFEIINQVIPYLQNDLYDYEFHITIDNKEYKNLFSGMEKWVINHGPVAPKNCPALYNKCDAMFLPSHLECFSASYPEAMKMQRPILTSNLTFATSVCGDAALYFDNENPKDIASKIIKLFNSEHLNHKLVEEGKKRLSKFDDSRSQAEKYLTICRELCKHE